MAGGAAVVRLREIRHTSDEHRTAVERLGDAALHLFLEAVHLHRRQELAIGELRQTVARTADSREALDVVVPRNQFVIANRPIHADALLCVGFEIHRTPAIALAAPHQ